MGDEDSKLKKQTNQGIQVDKGKTERGEDRGGQNRYVIWMQSMGEAGVVTTGKDPSIIGIYSDVLTIKKSDDTTITQSTNGSELRLQ